MDKMSSPLNSNINQRVHGVNSNKYTDHCSLFSIADHVFCVNY